MKKLFILSLLFVLSALYVCGQENDEKQYTAGLLPVGTEAPDFVIANGDSLVGVSLSSFRGHYVVLDFWASWCRDCRKDIPAVKELYNRYAPYGVDFIGVSFDNNMEAWRKCISDNYMNWIHHSELKPWKQTGISTDYGIKWLPTMYLIDKEGKVMFSTIHVNEMDVALSLVMLDAIAEARYPGGMKVMSKYVRNNLQYPDLAKELQAEGEAIMVFTLNSDGSVSDIKAVDGNVTRCNEAFMNRHSAEKQQELRKECSRQFAKEGYRIIKNMKKWKPAENGQPTTLYQRITFSLM